MTNINDIRIYKNDQNEEVYSLYKHTFPNDKIYIGITKYIPKYRWGKDGKGYKGQIVWKAIQKYGWENIKHEILLETTDKEFIEHEERRYITEIYHSNNKNFGYNINNGGNYAGEISEIVKQHLREINLGKKQSLETIEKKSKALKGRKASEETKEKQSKAAKGRIFTEEHKQHIREALLGKPNPRKGTGMTKEEKKKRHVELERIRRQNLEYREQLKNKRKIKLQDPEYKAQYNKKRREQRKRRNEKKLFLSILYLLLISSLKNNT